jgi:xylulokinase
MPQLLLGIDVGTYSSKGVLTDLNGTILKTHVIPHGISLPRPGWVEQDAIAVWWHDLETICKHLLDGQPFTGEDVAGVAVSAIGPCLLPLNQNDQALRPGILYGIDTRAQTQIHDLEREIGQDTIYRHGLMALTSQAVGPKIRWLREHEPDVWAQTKTITTASSYLTFRLTGRHVMDHHTASHFAPLYDPKTHAWTDQFAHEVLGDQNLERLPELGWSDELAGIITEEAAALTGLNVGTPVAVGAVDALSEAISVGAVHPGDLMVMYGSTTFFVLVQSQPTPDPRVWTVAGAFAGQFNLAAGMSTTGSLTRWFRDELARDLPEVDAYAQLFAGAALVAPGAQGLMVLPYFSGERTPINDPEARGIVAGLSLSHTREHMFRAVLEGVGYGIRHNLETFQSLGAEVKRVIAVGGGVTDRIWPQIVSDVSGKLQHLPRITIGASYGDAFLAGLAAGLLTRDDLERWVQFEPVIEPNREAITLYDERFGLYKNLYRQTRETVHQLQ